MGKFKVGDKVRILDSRKLVGNGNYRVTTGKEYEVISFHEKCALSVEHIKVSDNFSKPFAICDWEYKYIELVEQKQTKNQRITALEEIVIGQEEKLTSFKKELAELRPLKEVVPMLQKRVEELGAMVEKSVEPSTDISVEDIIEFEGAKYRKVDREAQDGDVIMYSEVGEDWSCVTPNKPYKVYQAENPKRLLFTRDSGIGCRVYDKVSILCSQGSENINVYELIKEDKPKTANELRAEVIEKAKRFVEESIYCLQGSLRIDGGMKRKKQGNPRYSHLLTKVNFEVNEEKRTVTATLSYLSISEVLNTSVAKCNPSDVFNEHIGKAIALGRALGLDVSEFEQVVQPSEVVVGMVCEVIDFLGNPYIETAYDGWDSRHTLKELNAKPNGTLSKIINDTNAIYGGDE